MHQTPQGFLGDRAAPFIIQEAWHPKAFVLLLQKGRSHRDSVFSNLRVVGPKQTISEVERAAQTFYPELIWRGTFLAKECSTEDPSPLFPFREYTLATQWGDFANAGLKEGGVFGLLLRDQSHRYRSGYLIATECLSDKERCLDELSNMVRKCVGWGHYYTPDRILLLL